MMHAVIRKRIQLVFKAKDTICLILELGIKSPSMWRVGLHSNQLPRPLLAMAPLWVVIRLLLGFTPPSFPKIALDA
jgi:hypothetical protein